MRLCEFCYLCGQFFCCLRSVTRFEIRTYVQANDILAAIVQYCGFFEIEPVRPASTGRYQSETCVSALIACVYSAFIF